VPAPAAAGTAARPPTTTPAVTAATTNIRVANLRTFPDPPSARRTCTSIRRSSNVRLRPCVSRCVPAAV